MEEILTVYQRPQCNDYPLVCLDEFSKQLLEPTRSSIEAAPGRTERQDSEYIRHGSTTAFMMYAPLEGKREVFISEDGTRTSEDYAHVLEYLVEDLYPDGKKIVVVEANLNTHGDASLYKAFLPDKARRTADRIERHHTPVHGSWLNLAEMEISALCRTTLTDRVKNIDEMRRLCALGVERRNDAAVTTNWQFSTADARTKLHRLYPSTQY